MRTILSIQSSVAYGHVGNSAATFPLMRRGIEVWPVLTVHFSNHTGYDTWRGPMFGADDVRAVIAGIDERGVLERCDAVLSGYQGAAEVSEAILDAVALVRRRNPQAVYCCDPVMGDDDRGVYVQPALPDLIRARVLPAAQIITPNSFELELLTGCRIDGTAAVLEAARQAREPGPEVVLVTSVQHAETPPGAIEMVVATAAGAWSVRTPRLAQNFTGTGDLTAAMFLAGMLETNDPAAALASTAAVVYGVLDATHRAGSRELALVQAQDEIVSPSRVFPVTRIA